MAFVGHLGGRDFEIHVSAEESGQGGMAKFMRSITFVGKIAATVSGVALLALGFLGAAATVIECPPLLIAAGGAALVGLATGFVNCGWWCSVGWSCHWNC